MVLWSDLANNKGEFQRSQSQRRSRLSPRPRFLSCILAIQVKVRIVVEGAPLYSAPSSSSFLVIRAERWRNEEPSIQGSGQFRRLLQFGSQAHPTIRCSERIFSQSEAAEPRTERWLLDCVQSLRTEHPSRSDTYLSKI